MQWGDSEMIERCRNMHALAEEYDRQRAARALALRLEAAVATPAWPDSQHYCAGVGMVQLTRDAEGNDRDQNGRLLKVRV